MSGKYNLTKQYRATLCSILKWGGKENPGKFPWRTHELQYEDERHSNDDRDTNGSSDGNEFIVSEDERGIEICKGDNESMLFRMQPKVLRSVRAITR
ncbi:hypothetical protein AAHA92_22208 [Salvia divinorum]|uniref:Uncharacterized protein n=1 Tax=Salvia divinorum TaxID=28513 RepID=A0ABD1GRF9_SALDI